MTEYYTRDQIDAMASILGDRIKESAEQAQRLPFIQWSSGRFYMETTTGTRWVADSDDNYGANYYQFAEPSGNNRATPIVEWEHRGLPVIPGQTVTGLIMKARVNNTSVPDVEMSMVAKRPGSIALANDGINSDTEVSYDTLWHDFWMAGSSSTGDFGLPKTGNQTHDHWRVWSFNHPVTMPTELSIYVRPSAQQTTRRYFLATYGWIVE